MSKINRTNSIVYSADDTALLRISEGAGEPVSMRLERMWAKHTPTETAQLVAAMLAWLHDDGYLRSLDPAFVAALAAVTNEPEHITCYADDTANGFAGRITE